LRKFLSGRAPHQESSEVIAGFDIAAAVKFAVEVAKEFGRATAEFYDAKEFARLNELYGSMHRLRHHAPRAE
jgi:hypothetical protein